MPLLPTEEQSPYENLDRLVRVVMRPKGMARYSDVNDLAYDSARGEAPISYAIAEALDPARPRNIGIFTGACHPDHYPNGENDGPLGAIVLAEALRKAGHRVSLFVDPPLKPVMAALMDYYGSKYPVTVLDIETPGRNTALATGLQAAIAVEKGGSNPAGKVHAINGYTREGTRAKVDGLFTQVQARGGITVSAADGVNEIGFGKVYDAVARAAPWTTQCRCGCGKGVMSSTSVTFLYISAVANWSAYGLAAALALYTRRPDLGHTPEAEADLERIAMRCDVRDGVQGKAALSVDGVPLEVTQAMLRMLGFLVNSALREYSRPF